MLDKENAITKTLDYYNQNAAAFCENTVEADMEDARAMLLKYLAPGAHLLDLGCGSGRDSKAFLGKGYKVTALDGSRDLCSIASEYIGQEVVCQRFQDMKYISEFDAVWASASILHTPIDNLPELFSLIFRALKAGGYFYVSFKHGDFEGERNGRYFTFLTEDKLRSLVEPLRELAILEVAVTNDVRPGREGEQWLVAIMQKQ